MKNQFKISVIIPIYNVEKYLRETIDSVINQTIGFEKNIELILINDGSPDNSEEICLEYKEKYPKNIIYYKQKNKGVSAARNKGIEFIHGELVNFLDSDDKWNLNAFKYAYNAYKKHPDISVFSCKMYFFDSKNENHPLNFKYRKEQVVNILEDYAYPQLSSSSVFIKRSSLKNHKYDTNIKMSEDNKFINEIIFENPNIMMLKKPIYYYRRRHDESSTIQNQNTDKSWYMVTPQKCYKYLFDLSKEKYGKVIEYIQYLVLYELNCRILYDNKKSPLNELERKKYSKDLIDLLKEIDEVQVLENEYLNLSKKCIY